MQRLIAANIAPPDPEAHVNPYLLSRPLSKAAQVTIVRFVESEGIAGFPQWAVWLYDPINDETMEKTYDVACGLLPGHWLRREMDDLFERDDSLLVLDDALSTLKLLAGRWGNEETMDTNAFTFYGPEQRYIHYKRDDGWESMLVQRWNTRADKRRLLAEGKKGSSFSPTSLHLQSLQNVTQRLSTSNPDPTSFELWVADLKRIRDIQSALLPNIPRSWALKTQGAVAKSWQRAVGIRYRTRGLDEDAIELACEAAFGGQVAVYESVVNDASQSVASVDYTGAYTASEVLQNVERLGRSARVRIDPLSPNSVYHLITACSPTTLLDPRFVDLWEELNILCRVIPDQDLLPLRAMATLNLNGNNGAYGQQLSYIAPREGLTVVRTIHDLIVSYLETGRMPHVLDAWRYEPDGALNELSTYAPLGFDGVGSFASHRARLSAQWKADHHPARPLLKKGNAATSGITLEKYPGDSFYWNATGQTRRQRERAGSDFAPHVYAFVTGGARLLACLLRHVAIHAGATPVLQDTDNLMFYGAAPAEIHAAFAPLSAHLGYGMLKTEFEGADGAVIFRRKKYAVLWRNGEYRWTNTDFHFAGGGVDAIRRAMLATILRDVADATGERIPFKNTANPALLHSAYALPMRLTSPVTLAALGGRHSPYDVGDPLYFYQSYNDLDRWLVRHQDEEIPEDGKLRTLGHVARSWANEALGTMRELRWQQGPYPTANVVSHSMVHRHQMVFRQTVEDQVNLSAAPEGQLITHQRSIA